MLNVSGLKYRYDGEERELVFPNFSCSSGEELLILGESGCGKSTLLHLITGLLPLQQGNVELNGQNIKALSASSLDKFRGQHIGIVFQQAHFVASMRVNENIQLAQQLAGNKPNPARIGQLLEELNIADKAKAKISTLSVGEKQRVSIARALVNEPALLVADEPTSALDDKNCEAVLNLLQEQASKNKCALLVVTHDNRLNARFSSKLNLTHEHA